MILVDAYGMYKLENASEDSVLDFRSFTDAVGTGLVLNQYDNGTKASRVRTSSVAFPESSTSPSRRVRTHTLLFLRNHGCMKKEGRKTDKFVLRCTVCGKHTSFYCGYCSTEAKAIAVCNTRNGVDHEQQCLSVDISNRIAIED